MKNLISSRPWPHACVDYKKTFIRETVTKINSEMRIPFLHCVIFHFLIYQKWNEIKLNFSVTTEIKNSVPEVVQDSKFSSKKKVVLWSGATGLRVKAGNSNVWILREQTLCVKMQSKLGISDTSRF